MSDLQLYFNQDAPNRSVSLVNKSGSNAIPILALPLVFADIYSTSLQFLNASGITSSYFNPSGSTATLALGVPGQPALALASCSIASSSSYFCEWHLNTTELSASLGSNRSKGYTIELQVISGSSVFSYQNPCIVYRDIVVNDLYPLNINYIISASYASFATSASYALSASWAPQQWNESGSNLLWTNKNVAINTGSNPFVDLMIRTALGSTGFMMVDNATGENVAWLINDGSGNGGTLHLNNPDQSHASELTSYSLTIDTGLQLNATIGDSYLSTSYNLGVGTMFPTEKVDVIGNVRCSTLTASIVKASAITASKGLIAYGPVVISGSSLSFITANGIYSIIASNGNAIFNRINGGIIEVTEVTASTILADRLFGTASYALNSSSASYATTSSNVSGQSVCNQYALSTGYVNYYTASITASANDDGRMVSINTASLYILTGSLSSNFTTMLYQSSSGQITITGSDSSVLIRNANSQKKTGAQDAIVSIIRLNTGAFILGGLTG